MLKTSFKSHRTTQKYVFYIHINKYPFFNKKESDKANLKVYKKLNRLFMPTILEIYRKKRVTKGI